MAGKWKLVPVEPTPEMKAAVRDIAGPQALAWALAGWETMVAASPSPGPEIIERIGDAIWLELGDRRVINGIEEHLLGEIWEPVALAALKAMQGNSNGK